MLVLRTLCTFICVVVVLCARATALPTMADYRDRASVAALAPSTGVTTSYNITDNMHPASWAFIDADKTALAPANISAYLAPLNDSAYPAAKRNVSAKTLPAVPGAVFMGIVGFLCVSLVRDRRVWLSVCVGIIVFSQAGVKTLPKLTARLARGRPCNKQASAAVAVNSLHVDDSFNWISDQPDRQYIALLHRLAASPDHHVAFALTNRGATSSSWADRSIAALRAFSACQNTTSLPSAFTPVQPRSNPLADRLSGRIVSISCFSPAFIFSNLARGPPLPAGENFSSALREYSRNARIALDVFEIS